MKNSRNFLGAKLSSSIKDAWGVRVGWSRFTGNRDRSSDFFFFETGLYVTGVTLELTKQPRITND